MSPALFLSVDDPLHHCINPVRKSRALAVEARVARHKKMNGLLMGAEKNIVSYKQSEIESVAFPAYKNVFTDVRSPERDKRMTAAATENREEGGERRMCLEQK